MQVLQESGDRLNGWWRNMMDTNGSPTRFRHRRGDLRRSVERDVAVTDRLTARDDRSLSHHVEWTLPFCPSVFSASARTQDGTS